METPVLEQELAAYETMRNGLEANHMGKWVIVHGQDLSGIYDSFEAAAEEAVRQFGRGPYLIAQVGAPPVILPASVMYSPDYGTNPVRF